MVPSDLLKVSNFEQRTSPLSDNLSIAETERVRAMFYASLIFINVVFAGLMAAIIVPALLQVFAAH